MWREVKIEAFNAVLGSVIRVPAIKNDSDVLMVLSGTGPSDQRTFTYKDGRLTINITGILQESNKNSQLRVFQVWMSNALRFSGIPGLENRQNSVEVQAIKKNIADAIPQWLTLFDENKRVVKEVSFM